MLLSSSNLLLMSSVSMDVVVSIVADLFSSSFGRWCVRGRELLTSVGSVLVCLACSFVDSVISAIVLSRAAMIFEGTLIVLRVLTS